MAGVQIRCYEDSDDRDVKEVFTLGMRGLLRTACLHVLKQPRIQISLMCVFCVLLASSKSLLLPTLAVTLLLVAGRQGIGHMIDGFIKQSMCNDLSSIRQTYLEQRNSCFWVAESQGQVVGTVSCLPVKPKEGYLELKRMSVRKSHRGQGIGKALCRTLEEFARDQGFTAVVLYTTVIQTDAQKLYECMGYKKIRAFAFPTLYTWITTFMVIEYMLNLQQPGK